MAEIHSVIRNIKSKNDLITNLADYKNIVLKDAYDLSLASLALNYVSLYETLSGTNAGEEEVTQDEALLGIYDALFVLPFLRSVAAKKENWQIKTKLQLKFYQLHLDNTKLIQQ